MIKPYQFPNKHYRHTLTKLHSTLTVCVTDTNKYHSYIVDRDHNRCLHRETHTNTHRRTDVLFSGVRQLVLPAAVVGLLDPRVGPQAFDSYDVGLVKASDLLDVHFLHEHGIGLDRQVRGKKVK